MAKPKLRKKKKPLISKNALMGIFIVILMVGSGMGLMLGRNSPNEQGGNYNDHNFVKTQNGYATEYKGEMMEFRYLPDAVDNINVTGQTLEILDNSRALYITFNPDDENIQNIEVARMQIERQFQKLDKYVGTGIMKNSTAYKNYPGVTCANASQQAPVMLLKSAETTGIEREEGCITLKFSAPAELFMLKDRILYGMIGVIE
ncbi:MAG: hypothetical protein ACOCZQ_00780 [Nanoarchaeota archaeon]